MFTATGWDDRILFRMPTSMTLPLSNLTSDCTRLDIPKLDQVAGYTTSITATTIPETLKIDTATLLTNIKSIGMSNIRTSKSNPQFDSRHNANLQRVYHDSDDIDVIYLCASFESSTTTARWACWASCWRTECSSFESSATTSRWALWASYWRTECSSVESSTATARWAYSASCWWKECASSG